MQDACHNEEGLYRAAFGPHQQLSTQPNDYSIQKILRPT